MLERRRALGGSLPRRVVRPSRPELPPAGIYEPFYAVAKGSVAASTTMAFVRLLRELLKDPGLGKRVVPIIPDEARTFGMESLFKQVGIYACEGQKYAPVDEHLLFSYTEKQDGQILEEGITECGCLASFTAAGTSYASHGEMMVPFYIFYSMFGFQRVGDSIWSFADSRGRGFLLGATAGRTTLNGEGLQHQDGHSPILASSVPNCLVYDPAYAYEVAVIIEDGLRRMVRDGEDVFYYVTLYNEAIEMPAMPDGAREGILDGLHRVRAAEGSHRRRVRLLGSGSILPGVVEAARMLEQRYQVSAEVWSATSYNQLRREALAVERWNLLHPEAEARVPRVTRLLPAGGGAVIAASDYMRMVPDQISRWVPDGVVSLGTDGFGLSDTRESLRRFFSVDSASVAVIALATLARRGELEARAVRRAMEDLGLDPEQRDPLLR